MNLQLSYTVSMDVFTQEPFNLKLGEMIYARGKAYNQAGWSPVSISNASGISVRGKPEPMTMLEKQAELMFKADGTLGF